MKKVLALIVLCFIAFNSHAQLRYQNGYLVYNAMERYNGYMTNWVIGRVGHIVGNSAIG